MTKYNPTNRIAEHLNQHGITPNQNATFVELVEAMIDVAHAVDADDSDVGITITIPLATLNGLVKTHVENQELIESMTAMINSGEAEIERLKSKD